MTPNELQATLGRAGAEVVSGGRLGYWSGRIGAHRLYWRVGFGRVHSLKYQPATGEERDHVATRGADVRVMVGEFIREATGE